MQSRMAKQETAWIRGQEIRLDILEDIRVDIREDIHTDIYTGIHTDIHADMIRYPHGYVTDIDSGYLHGCPIGCPIGYNGYICIYIYYGYVRMKTDMDGYPYISVHIRTKRGVQDILHGYVGPKLDMKGYPCVYLNRYPLG